MSNWSIVSSWNKYLLSFNDDQKDIYFTEEYVKLYETEKDISECFIYQDGNSIYLFPYLKREHSLFGERFFDFETQYGYGGPIANTNDTLFLQKAQSEFASYCYNNNFIAGFVRFHPLLENDIFFGDVGRVIQDRQTIAIDLTLTEADIWEKEIHSKHRNVIRKAESSGLNFEVDSDYKYMDDFVRLYEGTMNKVEADNYYFFDSNYYQRLVKNLKDSFLGVVKYDDKIVSAAIFFHSRKYGHYHLSGSDGGYLNLYPNNFLLYKVALHMKGLGLEKFHLGGGSSSDPNNSLLKFKERFSKNRYWFRIGKAIFQPEKYNYICDEWVKRNPDRSEGFNKILLKYRY